MRYPFLTGIRLYSIQLLLQKPKRQVPHPLSVYPCMPLATTVHSVVINAVPMAYVVLRPDLEPYEAEFPWELRLVEVVPEEQLVEEL